MNCVICGEKVGKNRQLYCGDRCYRDAQNAKRRKPNPKRKCVKCGKLHQRRGGAIYCSQKCAQKSWRKRTRKPRQKRVVDCKCPGCGSNHPITFPRFKDGYLQDWTGRGQPRIWCDKCHHNFFEDQPGRIQPQYEYNGYQL